MLRRKSKQFDGFEDLFFWGRESAEVVFTLDNYLLSEFEGKRAATEDDISFLSAVLRSKDLDLPQSISSAVEKRLQSSGD